MSAPVIPPGGTIVDTFKRSFVDVPVDAAKDNAISTSEFLEAAESLTTIFDALGSTAFSVVKNDMLKNIKKVRDRQLAAPAESETIQDLCRNELAAKKNTATEGLLWLTRGLDFTCLGVSKDVENPNKELADKFNEAYTQTLSANHGFLAKGAFTLAMKAVPYRKDFHSKLGSDEVKVQSDLDVYLAALQNIVDILNEFLGSLLSGLKWAGVLKGAKK